MSEIEHLLPVQNELGEGPLWNVEEQTLYWIDFEGACYHTLHPQSGTHNTFKVGERISALAFCEGGRLLLALESGLYFHDPASGGKSFIGKPEPGRPEIRFNDAAIDRQGRLWIGMLGASFSNGLYRLDPDGSMHRMDTGFDISNGIAWSPDNRTLYFADSTPCKIYAYDFDIETGTIANRRVFVDSSGQPGVPDGLTVDSEGFVWSARWGGSCIERYDPAGRLERRITMPVHCPSSVTFGGPDLSELYVTSARVGVPAELRGRPSPDGDLFRIHTGFTGLPEPLFAGQFPIT